MTSPRELEKVPKVEGVLEVHAGHAEDLSSRGRITSCVRHTVKATTLSPQRRHRETRHISRTIGSPLKFVASAGEGKGKKKKRGKREGKGKGHVNQIQNFLGSPLLQL